MENPEKVFKEIVQLFSGVLSKPRNQISFTSSIMSVEKNKYSAVLVISKGGVEIMTFKESIFKQDGSSVSETKESLKNRIFTKAIKTIFNYGLEPSSISRFKTKNTLEDFEELWEKHSEYIGEDIDSLQYISGTLIMKEIEFKNALSSFNSNN